MANDKTTKEIIRSSYVQKCAESNELYTLTLGKDKQEVIMELPKSWFRGVGRPKKGSKLTLIQTDGRLTRMLLNNKQFFPSLNPLSRAEISSRKC